jgi:hypothetical protein
VNNNIWPERKIKWERAGGGSLPIAGAYQREKSSPVAVAFQRGREEWLCLMTQEIKIRRNRWNTRGRRRRTGSGVVVPRVWKEEEEAVLCNAKQGFTSEKNWEGGWDKLVILNIVRDIIVVSHLKMEAPTILYTVNTSLLPHTEHHDVLHSDDSDHPDSFSFTHI